MTILYQNTTDSRVLIRDLLVWDPQKGTALPLEFGPYEAKDVSILGVDENQLAKSSGWKYFTSLGTVSKVVPLTAHPITETKASEESTGADTNSDTKADKKRLKRR